MKKIGLGSLSLPENWDDPIYRIFTPALWGTPLKDLTIQVETSIVMMATGGLMSLKTSLSMLLAATINYVFIAPYLIHENVIAGPGLKNILLWALWGGTAIMTTSSLYGFFARPDIIISAFKRKKTKEGTSQTDILANIELPMKVFVIGIPIISAITVWMGHTWFGVEYWLGLIAIPLIFVFTLIAVNATGLTAITPGSSLAKLTQVCYSLLAPGNIGTNLMTAGMTSEVSLNASNLLMDIKPGYMLGAKPRHQAIGHVLGIFAGGLVAVPVFYSLFNNDLSLFNSEKLPLPSAAVWKSVAEVLTKGLSSIHISAQYWFVIGALIGILIEFLGNRSKGKFPLSGVGLGLGFVLSYTNSLMMALGSLLFWLFEKKARNELSLTYRVFVSNRETLAAGCIAGGSIIGLLLMIFS